MKSKNFPYSNGREYHTKLINAAYISLGLPLIVFLWTFLEFLENNLEPFFPKPLNYLVIALFALLSCVFIWIANKVFKNGLPIAKNEHLLEDKLIIYKKITTRKFTYLFFASVFIITGLYISASEIFAGLYFVIIIIFSMGSPTKDKIARDLNLRSDDRKIILTGGEFDSRPFS